MVVFLFGFYHGVFASASPPLWALAGPSTDSIALLAFATAFRSWPQPQWALLLYAASTTFSGTGIPPSAQLSTLLLALSPMPRCLDALRILFGCCSMALVPSTTCHAACYGLLSGYLFSGCAAFGLPLAPLTLLLPASPLAIYSLCPLHSGIQTGASVIIFALCHGVSPCRHGFRGRCFHMRPWAFGPPAKDCEPCLEVWPSGLSCSGSCRQLVDLNCPSARRGCLCGFRVSLSAMLSGILCPNRCWCYVFWLLPRRFAMPPRLQGALLPYAALGLRPPSYRLRALP